MEEICSLKLNVFDCILKFCEINKWISRPSYLK